MCGIPMLPAPDYTDGKVLSFEACVAHLGGPEQLITAAGREMIDRNRIDYLWKYPEHGYCTFCGEDVGDFKARHNAEVTCPACGRGVIFKHESRGHQKIYDQFCMYEWRKSAIDPETVCLTACHVWRDSTHPRPEREPLHTVPTAIYIFRPGKAVTVFKRDYYHTTAAWDECWSRVHSVHPDHTAYMAGKMEIVQSYGQFRAALSGTRIGATFDRLAADSNTWETLELSAIAACARRPWLEYLAKCGQAQLAAELMRMPTVSRDVIPNQRAKKPRDLLGLAEAQWYETRRDGIELTAERLQVIHAINRMGLKMHMAEIIELTRRDGNAVYHVDGIAPSASHKGRYARETICDLLIQAGVGDKTRRKVCRRILGDLQNAGEWRDYLLQLRRLGEDMTDTALLLPRDMPAMHQRMIERENLLRQQAEAKRLAKQEAALRARLPRLRRDYAFNACGLTLRPFETAAEVMAEGRALSICIGSYAERYINGGTIICCLRKAEEPDVPWRAVEFDVKTGALLQDRGWHNDMRGGIEPGTRKQLRLFWRAFERARTARREEGKGKREKGKGMAG